MSSRAIAPMRSTGGHRDVVYDPVLGTTLAQQTRARQEAMQVPTTGVAYAMDALHDPAPNVLRELNSIHSMRDLHRAVGDGVKRVKQTASQYQLGDDAPPPVHVAVVDAHPGHTLEAKASRAIRFAYICAFLITLPLAVGLLFAAVGDEGKGLGASVAVVLAVLMVGTIGATVAYVVRVLRARNLALAVLGLAPESSSAARPAGSLARKGSGRGGKGGGGRSDSVKAMDVHESVDLKAVCTECNNPLGERCGRFNHTGGESACPPTVGKCGHVFHFHCIVLVLEQALRFGEPATCPHKGDIFLWEWKRRDDRDHYTALREGKLAGLGPGERRGRLGPRRATTGTLSRDTAPRRDVPAGGRAKRKGSATNPSHGGGGGDMRGKRSSSSRRIEVAPSGRRRSGERLSPAHRDQALRGLSRHASAMPAMH